MRLLTQHLTSTEDRPVLPFEWAPLIRNFMRGEGPAQERARELAKQGERFPIFLAPSLWLPALEHLSGKEHLLVDGVPRHRIEAELFDSLLRFYKRAPVHVVHLDIPEDIAAERLVARGREEGREDDMTDEAIERRLEWYMTDTLPLLDYFGAKEHYRIHGIDGTQSREAIAEAVDVAVQS
jgi:adenylate kinase